MPDSKGMLSSQEFAEKAGVSTSTVSKWLRSGKIKGSKEAGKWMISTDQLAAVSSPAAAVIPAKSVAPTAAKKETTPASTKANKAAYTIEEFSAISYLTPFGVERYLKEGRLSGLKNSSGQWQVDGSNITKEDIQHLLRK
ncbi:MAG: helix-turn-helix domain-containing protein [Desulfobacteraceae bacterium]|nr:helix-turn-helix domain-containing protein [Desulfobacteraceae bacterium]